MENSERYGFGPQPFMEEYLADSMEICGETEVAQYMPVAKRMGSRFRAGRGREITLQENYAAMLLQKICVPCFCRCCNTTVSA